MCDWKLVYLGAEDPGACSGELRKPGSLRETGLCQPVRPCHRAADFLFHLLVQVQMKDFRFSYKFKMACKEDVLKLCPNIKKKYVAFN